MARRKEPITLQHWTDEISFQLLKLVRKAPKDLEPTKARVMYFALRDLAKIHSVQLDSEFEKAINAEFKKAQTGRVPKDPTTPWPVGTTEPEEKPLTEEQIGGILDEMGDD